MKKSDLVKETLKKIIETSPLKDITVQELCKKSNIKRQTFYYHFKDIYDVVMSIFLNEKVENIDEAEGWPEIIHCILVYSFKNRQLVLKTLKSNASEAVEMFFYNNLYIKGKHIIIDKYGKFLNQKEIVDITKLISDTLSRELTRLLTSPYEMSIGEIEESISKTFDGVLELICENKIANKRRKV